MAKKGPSVRSIARLAGYSKATVANALRGDRSVAPATAERILQVASDVGYERNRLVTGLMSAMRRSQTTGFHGVLASVDFAEPDRPAHGPFHLDLVAGSRARAEELGYKIEEYVVGEGALSLARLESILKARGIHGIMVLPSWRPPNLSGLDWRDFAAVSADVLPPPLQLHSVCCDHYRSVFALLEYLWDRGYRRPGLVLERGRDERDMLRRSAALQAFQRRVQRAHRVPLLDASGLDSSVFGEWFRRYRPDVVLAHEARLIDRVEAEGAAVPADCGFVCLNLAKTRRACAGLDLQPRLIGARSVELLIAQLQQNVRGIPEYPSTLTLPARIVEGPTLESRTAPGVGKGQTALHSIHSGSSAGEQAAPRRAGPDSTRRRG